MTQPDLNDLVAFLAVARERSFTKAAASLGKSQSALSKTISDMEAGLGVRLLSRTTRSVSPTEAGERLFQSIAPDLEHIASELDALSAFREKPAGTIRITTGEHPARSILQPALARLLPQFPDIRVELSIDYGLTDIVSERFDAGVRLGEQVAKDMIAVPIGPDGRMAVVGARSYFARNPEPETPQDLVRHNCINLRLPTSGGLLAWEFGTDGRDLKVRVEGQLSFNRNDFILDAALAGLGLAYLPRQYAAPQLASGALVEVLAEWCPLFPGYYLYYPSRRQPTPAFALLIQAIRYRERGSEPCSARGRGNPRVFSLADGLCIGRAWPVHERRHRGNCRKPDHRRLTPR